MSLFALCGAFVFISQIKTLKVWEMQVELFDKLDEAKNIMVRLRRLSAISAKSTYMQMAWGNRMGTPPAREKQAILDEIDTQVKELEANPDEVAAIKKPFVQMVTFDFFMLYKSVLRAYARHRHELVVDKARTNPHALELREEHVKGTTSWSERTNDFNPAALLRNSSLEVQLDRVTPTETEWMNVQERELAGRIKAQILRLDAESVKRGGYTEEAAAFYDHVFDHEQAYAERQFAPALDALRK